MVMKPKIYSRDYWGARKGGGTVYGGKLSSTYYRATVHHDAAFASGNMTTAQAMAHVKNHQNTHMNVNGWSDIGYHFLIAPGGEIIEGRPLNTQGAHVEYENYGNVGVCLMGQLHIHSATKAQLQSCKELYAWLCQELQLDYSSLKGHSDYMPTACPGSFYSKIPEVRAYAKQTLSGNRPLPPKAPTIEIDGKYVGDVEIIDGQSFFPIRDLAANMGWEVKWDSTTKTVKLSTEENNA